MCNQALYCALYVSIAFHVLDPRNDYGARCNGALRNNREFENWGPKEIEILQAARAHAKNPSHSSALAFVLSQGPKIANYRRSPRRLGSPARRRSMGCVSHDFNFSTWGTPRVWPNAACVWPNSLSLLLFRTQEQLTYATHLGNQCLVSPILKLSNFDSLGLSQCP